ncbi:MAG: extracellular solute-binding protein [Christensenellales bacterium]|jgi:putative aldouronate transport system substrate-binding protein
MKRYLSIALLICMLVTPIVIAEPSDVAWAPETMPFFDDPHTLSLVTMRNILSTVPSEEKWFYKWASGAMGLNFEITEVEYTERNEKLNLIFASDDLPDVFYNCDLTANEIALYGAKEQQLIPLNDLIDQYAPNIKAFMEAEPEIAATFYYTDGNIYSLPSFIGYNSYENYTTTRAWINQTWLKNLGLENPTTLDEFYEVLKAFKEKDANGNGDPNDEIPLGENIQNLTLLMLNLMGVMTRSGSTLDPAICKGKAIIPANEKDLYKNFLSIMSKYYAEGLIDQDVFTLTGTQQQANATANIIGLHMQGAPYSLPIADYNDWTTIRPMTSEYNDTLLWPESNPLQIGKFSITHKCEDPEAAIRFADWHFTQQGSLYSFFGPAEGSEDTLGMVGGWYYKDDTESVDFRYSDGIEKQVDYVAWIGNGSHTHVGISMNYTALETLLGHKITNQAFAGPAYWRNLMNEYVVPYYSACYPPLYFTLDTSARQIELQTPLNDYITIMEAKFISGEIGIDQFDSYYEELQKMGLGEFASYYESAYAEYLSRM